MTNGSISRFVPGSPTAVPANRGTRALFTIALVCGAARTAHAQWDAETVLTDTGSDVWGEGIAASGSSVYMVYGTNEVRFRSSSDEGATWSADAALDDGTLHLTDPM